MDEDEDLLINVADDHLLVRVRWSHVDVADSGLDDGWLDDHERHRASAYRRRSDRLQFVRAALLLRRVLSDVVGERPQMIVLDRTCPVCGAPHGRITLPDHVGVHVSVTHSAGLVGVAVAPARVGIDVERLDPALPRDEVADLVLAPAEAQARSGQVTSGHPSELLATWVRKEAVLKALGVGLTVPMTDLVLSPSNPPAVVRWPAGAIPDAATITDLVVPELATASPAGSLAGSLAASSAGHVGALAVLAP